MTLWSKFDPQDAVSAAELERGQRWLLRSGIAGKVMDTLAVGAFMTAFALELGAGYAFIGMLAAIPHLGNIGQIVGVTIIERMRRRKAICIGFGMLVRPMLLVVAAAALIPNAPFALGLVMLGLTIRYLFGSVILCSWNSWIRDLVPEGQRTDFLARRLRGMMFFGMIATLCAAAFIDHWPKFQLGSERMGYAIVFVVAFLCGAYNTYALRHVPELRMADPEASVDLWEVYRKPFRDVNFRRLMMFLGTWNFAVNLAVPFFTVHMLVRLGFDLLPVTLFAILSQLANILVIRRWGRVADRYSNKFVLRVCAPLFLMCIFAWIFTTMPERHDYTVALLIAIHVLTGIASAGVGLASSNLSMKLAPMGEATSYLSANSIVNSISAGLAPVLGGLLADFFISRRFSVVAQWATPEFEKTFEALRIEQWDFFFISAAILGLYSLHRLSHVREEGEVEERAVLEEMLRSARAGLQTFSTVAGLRQITEFPFDLGRRLRGKKPDDKP